MEVKTIMLFDKPLINRVIINYPIHMHTPMPMNEAGFVYVLQGKCVNHSELEEMTLVEGDAVLAKSGNSTFKTLANNGEVHYDSVVIKFHKDVIEKLYEHEENPLLKNGDIPLNLNSSKMKPSKMLSKFVFGLLDYFEEDVSEELLKLKMKELIALLLHSDNAPEIKAIMRHLFEEKLFKFREIIEAHICSSLSLEELAQLTNCSMSSFKKRFKAIFNDTPNNYLIQKRTERVATLLRSTNDSISDIAYDCEFKTLAHLSRVFKTKYGVAPSQYRLTLTDK